LLLLYAESIHYKIMFTLLILLITALGKYCESWYSYKVWMVYVTLMNTIEFVHISISVSHYFKNSAFWMYREAVICGCLCLLAPRNHVSAFVSYHTLLTADRPWRSAAVYAIGMHVRCMYWLVCDRHVILWSELCHYLHCTCITVFFCCL